MQWVGSRSYGVTLVAIAGVLWSTGGLFVRALESLDLATMVAWRSLFAALALAVVIVAFNRRAASMRCAAWAGPG
jgi:EamA domain-containing membrane protein RarD